jgi:murein DD-endopeptidase MepM/ murein hydrolase activator NlpD
MGLYIRGKGVDGLYYYFAHNSKVIVSVGQLVKKGMLIATEGSTGHSSGSHCHYEVRTKAGDNASFVDISKLSGIPNELGIYFQEVEMSNEIQEGTLKVGETTIEAKIIDGVMWTPTRATIDAVLKEPELTWDQPNKIATLDF